MSRYLEIMSRIEAKVDKVVERLDCDDKFDFFWDEYPRRNGTKGNRKVSKRLWDQMDKGTRESVLAALVSYKSYLATCDQSAMDAQRFLRGEWETYTAAEIELVDQSKGKWLS